MIMYLSSYVIEGTIPARAGMHILTATINGEIDVHESAPVTEEMWQYLLERVKGVKFIGVCRDCQYWDPKSDNVHSRECLSPEFSEQVYIPFQETCYRTDATFGCIHFTREEVNGETSNR